MSVVEALGRCTVKGTRWQWTEGASFTTWGMDDDRLWTPVSGDLHAVRATDLPGLVGLEVTADEIADALTHRIVDGQVRYYDRTLAASVHGGRLAERISQGAGRELLLARSATARRFIWSSPVSVLLRSELSGLPDELGRYRPNIVLDDREDPLALVPGVRLGIGGLLLEVERELDRCLVINHHPLSGTKDHSLLRQLRPGALLGHGCRVVTPGHCRVGDRIRIGRAG